MERDLHIKKELLALAPKLINVEITKPNLPEDYFLQMTDKVLSQIHEMDSAEIDLQPYFEKLPDEVWQKANKSAKTKVLNFRTYATFAAAMALVFSFVFLIKNEIIPVAKSDNLAVKTDLTEEELLFVLTEYTNLEQLVYLEETIQEEDGSTHDNEFADEDIMRLLDAETIYSEIHID